MISWHTSIPVLYSLGWFIETSEAPRNEATERL